MLVVTTVVELGIRLKEALNVSTLSKISFFQAMGISVPISIVSSRYMVIVDNSITAE